MFFVVDDLLNWRKEDIVVEVDQVYLVSFFIKEGVFVAVEAENELIVVAENFLKAVAWPRSIDAEDTSDRAHYNLIYPVIFQ